MYRNKLYVQVEFCKKSNWQINDKKRFKNYKDQKNYC